MPVRSRADVAVRKRLQSLDRGLTDPLGTDAEALHRTRVASRRLREALPLLLPAGGHAPLGELKQTIRDMTRALGGVREMDVALTLVDALISDRPDLQPALHLVRAAIGHERLTRLDRMRGQVDIRRLRRVSRVLAEHVGQSEGDDDRSAELLAERLLDRAADLRRAVDDAGLLYAPERLHRVRLATKKLRYILELAGEIRAASTRSLVTELQRAQQRLGLLHDLEVVARHARQTFGQPHVPEPAAQLAAPTLALLEERIHLQHADYLANREELLRVIDRAVVVRKRVRATA